MTASRPLENADGLGLPVVFVEASQTPFTNLSERLRREYVEGSGALVYVDASEGRVVAWIRIDFDVRCVGQGKVDGASVSVENEVEAPGRTARGKNSQVAYEKWGLSSASLEFSDRGAWRTRDL